MLWRVNGDREQKIEFSKMRFIYDLNNKNFGVDPRMKSYWRNLKGSRVVCKEKLEIGQMKADKYGDG